MHKKLMFLSNFTKRAVTSPSETLLGAECPSLSEGPILGEKLSSGRSRLDLARAH